MKEIYFDIIEKSLSAYTDERIRDYIDEVKRDGLTEHGFARLASNIGILIANGRRYDLLDTFVEMMNICCDEMPCKKAANDFSMREICCTLLLLEQKQIVDSTLLNKWKEQLKSFDPWKYYTLVDDNSGRFINNWALFATVSEYMRGVLCGIDTLDFIEHQLPSHLANLDKTGMYMDHGPIHNPVVYEVVARLLFAFLLHEGYNGKYAKAIEDVLDSTADITLKMQSVTGELPFGGRSNQFLHNEMMLGSYLEMEATRHFKKGDIKRAGEFKAAALLSANKTLEYLSLDPISHVKNRYDIKSKIGCEGYGYFNKYMITVASNAYMALRYADDDILPSVAPAISGGYVISTGDTFHKTFLSAGGYHLEFETNADLIYDANGLGRVHKIGCPSVLCLSMPFARKPRYVTEGSNRMAMSLCCYAEKYGKRLVASEHYAKYFLVNGENDKNKTTAVFDVSLPLGITVTQKYTVSKDGVDILLSGCENVGFMLPVFDFDGKDTTKITLNDNEITVEYQGAVCRYCFDGKINTDFKYFYNRNGRYRVFDIASNQLHIEMESANEL